MMNGSYAFGIAGASTAAWNARPVSAHETRNGDAPFMRSGASPGWNT